MALQMCKTCGVEHPLEAFETYTVNGAIKHRKECKEARKERRKKAVAEAPPVNREEVPLPERCTKCGEAPPIATFSWIKGVRGSWRTICNACGSVGPDGVTRLQAYRKREMERDPEGFRAQNAAMMRAWVERKKDEKKKEEEARRRALCE
jgi:hypothetical protein